MTTSLPRLLTATGLALALLAPSAAHAQTQTDLPVGEIAGRLGFESGSALARAMRRVTGQTPSVIRHNARSA